MTENFAALEDGGGHPGGEATARQHRTQERLLAAVRKFLGESTVTAAKVDGQLTQLFTSTRLGSPVTTEEYVEFLIETVLPHSINMSSPRCMGHMTSALPDFVAPVSQFITSLNQNLVKVEASKALTHLERQTLGMLHRLVYGCSEAYYREHVHREQSTLGVMTGGGTLANITALWVARNARLGPNGDFGGVEGEGLVEAAERHGRRRMVVLGPETAHYSFEKAVSLLGLGGRSLVPVPVDGANRLDPGALRRAVRDCRERGWMVLMIVAVAGATDSGSVDPLDEIGALAGEEGVHFHVDAAWGAPLLFSEQHRHRLAGIERADSVTIDGHKQLYLPMGTGMLLFKDPECARVIEKHSSYILQEGSGDQGRRSLEGSRLGAALFVHAGLSVIGPAGYGKMVEASIERTMAMAELVRASPDFELLMEPEMNILLYRYLPPACRESARAGRLSAGENLLVNECNTSIQRAQYEAGRSLVGRTTLRRTGHAGGDPVVALRAVLANPRVGTHDCALVLREQAQLGAALADRVPYGRVATGAEAGDER